MVYFLPKKHARLGNWLFQYAVAASIGDGCVATLDTDFSREAVSRYADFLHELKLVSTIPEGAFRVVENVRKPERFTLIPDSRTVVLDGYFQRFEYLNRQKVVSQFSIPSGKIASYKARFGAWLTSPSVTSVHVRRGDYLKLSHCHPFVGEQYFRDCIARLPDVRDFMVFSDDIPWCKNFFPDAFPDRRFCFVEGTDMIDDLHLQSLCKNNIISNSSFSWWAAYLNENPHKRILVPDNWFGFYLRAQGVNGNGMYYAAMEQIPIRYSLRFKAKAVLDMMREVPLNMAAAAYHFFIPR